MLAALDQTIREFWLYHSRPPDLADYTPYLLAIGGVLVWFVRGLIGDCVRDLRYRMRRRALRVLPGGPGDALRRLPHRPLAAVPTASAPSVLPPDPVDPVRIRSRI